MVLVIQILLQYNVYVTYRILLETVEYYYEFIKLCTASWTDVASVAIET